MSREAARRDATELVVVAIACVVASLALLVPAVAGALGPAPVVDCYVPPCSQPTKSWGLIIGSFIGGATLLLLSVGLVLSALRAPQITLALAAAVALFASGLGVLSAVPQVAAIPASWQSGVPASGEFPVLVPPWCAGASTTLVIALVVALMLSRRPAPHRSLHPTLSGASEVTVLLIVSSWFSVVGNRALSTIRFRPLDWGAAQGSTSQTQWVLDLRAAGLFLVLAVLAVAVLGIMVGARRTGRRRFLAVAAVTQLLLVIVTVVAGSPAMRLLGWTVLDSTPAWPVSPSALGLLLAAGLTLAAMTGRPRAAGDPHDAARHSPRPFA